MLNKENVREVKAKRTAKNSVFLDLFKGKTYLLQLYQALHPEDTEATEAMLADATIKNVLTDNQYNDLGFIARGRLMILVEAQSTWTVNILVRIFLYLAESYHEYVGRTEQNLYGNKKVTLPKPELYVIYTGNRFDKAEGPDVISLAKEFFGDVDADLEVKVKVIYESDGDDIISQYIIFCKVFNEQTRRYGMTEKAVAETIRICKDRNVLKEYLEGREKEVGSIMKYLFDEEEIQRLFLLDKLREEALEIAGRMMKKGMDLKDIADCVPSIPLEELQELQAEIMQLA